MSEQWVILVMPYSNGNKEWYFDLETEQNMDKIGGAVHWTSNLHYYIMANWTLLFSF